MFINKIIIKFGQTEVQVFRYMIDDDISLCINFRGTIIHAFTNHYLELLACLLEIVL